MALHPEFPKSPSAELQTDHDISQPGGEVLLYRTEDGQTRLETRMMGETVWLSLGQMSTLF